MDEDSAKPRLAPMVFIELIGARTLSMLDAVGAAWYLLVDAIVWLWRGLTDRKVRIGRPAIISQMVRVGVRSIFIIAMVSSCVGFILALQMAPPLDKFGSKDLVANITGVAIFRELGPLIAAIVLTGFAGAAIAAEIEEGEKIKRELKSTRRKK